MDNATLVSKTELEHIDTMLADVNTSVSICMAYIRKLQGWHFDQFETQFKGVPASMWQRYLQPSYTKMRPLHVVAAFSWITMVPMPSFYRGLKIKEAYRGMDEQSVEAMLHSGILPKQQFQLLMQLLYEYLTPSQQKSTDRFIASISKDYGSLDDYQNRDFLFPKQLDMELFAYDYYRSVALAFRKLREKNKLNIATMAHALNLSPYRYTQCENPENPVPLPIEIAARLKLCFQIRDAMPFTANMTHYPEFHTMRLVQHIRETQIVECMKGITEENKPHAVSIIQNMAHIHVKSSRAYV